MLHRKEQWAKKKGISQADKEQLPPDAADIPRQQSPCLPAQVAAAAQEAEFHHSLAMLIAAAEAGQLSPVVSPELTAASKAGQVSAPLLAVAQAHSVSAKTLAKSQARCPQQLLMFQAAAASMSGQPAPQAATPAQPQQPLKPQAQAAAAATATVGAQQKLQQAAQPNATMAASAQRELPVPALPRVTATAEEEVQPPTLPEVAASTHPGATVADNGATAGDTGAIADTEATVADTHTAQAKPAAAVALAQRQQMLLPLAQAAAQDGLLSQFTAAASTAALLMSQAAAAVQALANLQSTAGAQQDSTLLQQPAVAARAEQQLPQAKPQPVNTAHPAEAPLPVDWPLSVTAAKQEQLPGLRAQAPLAAASPPEQVWTLSRFSDVTGCCLTAYTRLQCTQAGAYVAAFARLLLQPL